MATLKISDLSVGDWVRYKGEPSRVLDCGMLVVSATSISFEPRLAVKAKYDIFDSVNIEKIEPIPITAEILEKNEIHRTYNDDEYAIFRGDGLWAIKYSDGDWELSTPPVCRVDIKYIHQLQHALRLAGVDKEINL